MGAAPYSGGVSDRPASSDLPIEPAQTAAPGEAGNPADTSTGHDGGASREILHAETTEASADRRPARRRPALSPSRAKDFLQCPLLYRLRTIDRLPEPPSPAATKGTLVHSVLERLYDLPASGRVPVAALDLVAPAWEELQRTRPEVLGLFDSPAGFDDWLRQARALVERYFEVENPQRLEPAEREKLVEVELGSGVLLRGFIDRIDVAPTGAVRVVDYKTGRSPKPQYSADALFQMRFYALMLWRIGGTPPTRLQLVYLGDGRVLTLDPSEEELLATEAEIERIWNEIRRAARAQHFAPRPSRLCDWCSFKPRCPAFGGEPPSFPAERAAQMFAGT